MILSRALFGFSSFFILCSFLFPGFRRLLSTTDELDVHGRFDKYDEISTSFDNVFWIVQISDLHLSIFHDSSRVTEFSEFCNNTLNVIKPSVVLATGDLTDGVGPDKFESNQYEEEWMLYNIILHEYRLTQNITWLDIRGNHDNFNVPGVNYVENYFRKYGIQGPKHSHSYLYEVRMRNGEVVSFIASDACIKVGVRRPFNFIGTLQDDDLEILEDLSEKVRSGNSSYLFWFGHYPTSTIISPGADRFRSIMKSNNKSVAYVSGHLHTLGGLVPHMYVDQDGFLELEVGDWKEGRIFRVMAIDHGEFSFVDVHHGDWPHVLVTHPKQALIAPLKNLTAYIQKLKYIRMLVFSPIEIESVNVQIDDGIWHQCEHVKGPLYVSPWNASLYAYNIHIMKVSVTDVDGKNKTVTHAFSLDGTRLSFKILARMVLLPNIYSVTHFLFVVLVMLSVMPLLLCRIFDFFVKMKLITDLAIIVNARKMISRRYWLMSRIDRICYSLILYAFWLYYGPWSVGDLLEGHLGFVFSWGIIVNGAYVKASSAYMFGCFHLLLVHLPFVILLGYSLDARYKNLRNRGLKGIIVKGEKCYGCYKICWNKISFAIICLFHSYDMYIFWNTFGTYSLLFSPVKFWYFLLILYLRLAVYQIPAEKLLNAGRIRY